MSTKVSVYQARIPSQWRYLHRDTEQTWGFSWIFAALQLQNQRCRSSKTWFQLEKPRVFFVGERGFPDTSRHYPGDTVDVQNQKDG